MRVLTAALMLVVAAPAAAAPLCTASNGHFTPCAPHEIARVKQRDARVEAKKQAVAERDRREAIAHPERPPKPPRKPLFAVGRLCRDSKGMATPCPR